MQSLLTDVNVNSHVGKRDVEMQSHVHKRSVVDGDEEVILNMPTVDISYCVKKTFAYSMIKSK